ncbi:unnamed protein product [Urochloa decumbens]|uniref:SWIM-type domain-containing protein n=1 Tax=Urochloa decumbens TaxID=240449 RepID=A0ABC9EX51_9POAL
MDLNQVPEEFDYDFLDAVTANPLFCTQPMSGLEDSNQIGSSSSQFEVANQTSGFTQPAALDAQEGDGDDITDDVWCTPPIPYTGQTFGSKAEVRQYYNSYAKRIGFSIRTSTSRLSGDTREQLKVTYVCNKQGRVKQEAQQKAQDIPESDDDDDDDIQEGSEPNEGDDGAHKKKKKLDGVKKRKREKMQRTDCKARFVVKLIGDRWHAIHFVADHNHDLIVKPSLKKFLRSHKGIPPEEKQIITLLHDTNISTSRVMQLMNMFYGSAQKVPYEGKDVGNFRSGIRRTEKYMDMQETLDYFMELEEEDPDFFHKVKLDKENRVESIFWVDGAARHAYIESYHDCVSFDATYMTNMYDMPFTPFIGISSHGQSFQLGCAFLRDEKTPSYKWLFETFLEAMKGKAPLNIITDQDVLKKYVNPNMSILHFVRQYQKLQEKCLVAEEGQDFRTEDRERRRFSNEFEKIAEYDVEPKGEFQYLLVPNNTKVYGYGKRSYLVTAIADESSFYCECSKYDRDGILCCHVMKVLTRLGVKTIPEQYIMKRWSLKAVESNDNSTANTHMKADFIARADGCLSSERYNIMQDHIKQMRSAINEIKKRKRASRQKEINRPPAASGAQAQAGPSCVDGAAAESVGCLFATAPTAGDGGIPVSVPAAISTPVGNPPRSKVKGRKKEKRLKKGMNAEPKRKNKCRICKKEGHTAPRCPDREGEGVSSVQ